MRPRSGRRDRAATLRKAEGRQNTPAALCVRASALASCARRVSGAASALKRSNTRPQSARELRGHHLRSCLSSFLRWLDEHDRALAPHQAKVERPRPAMRARAVQPATSLMHLIGAFSLNSRNVRPILEALTTPPRSSLGRMRASRRPPRLGRRKPLPPGPCRWTGVIAMHLKSVGTLLAERVLDLETSAGRREVRVLIGIPRRYRNRRTSFALPDSRIAGGQREIHGGRGRRSGDLPGDGSHRHHPGRDARARAGRLTWYGETGSGFPVRAQRPELRLVAELIFDASRPGAEFRGQRVEFSRG